LPSNIKLRFHYGKVVNQTIAVMQRTKNPIQNIYIKPSINAPIQIPMKYMVITNKIADITIKNIDKKSIG